MCLTLSLPVWDTMSALATVTGRVFILGPPRSGYFTSSAVPEGGNLSLPFQDSRGFLWEAQQD